MQPVPTIPCTSTRIAALAAGLALAAVTAGCGPRRAQTPNELAGASGPWLDPPAADGAIGADASVFVLDLAADGGWLLLCQSVDTDHDDRRRTSWVMRETVGDRLFPTLVLGSGQGAVVEGLLATSADDRWLAVWRTGGLHLIDVRARQVTELAPVLVEARSVPPIAAAFAGDRWMAWALGDRVTVRALAGGDERTLALGGRVWSLAPEPSATGDWVRAEVIRRDSDGDGRIEARWSIGSSHPGPCSHPWDGDSLRRGGDEPDVVWIDLATATVHEQAPPPPAVVVPPPPRARPIHQVGVDRVVATDARGRRLLATSAPGPRELPLGPLRWER
ncbi:MAG: hypothetical protein KJZ91_25210 [Myxococcales bacterium]|nr:hypothetical protein [Myxococcales bacterium]